MSFDFSRLIKDRRKELNITQRELANKAGVSLRTIQRIETEPGAQIRMSTLSKLAEPLDMPFLSNFDNLEYVETFERGYDIGVLDSVLDLLNSAGRAKVKEYAFDIVHIKKYQNEEKILEEIDYYNSLDNEAEE